MLATKPGHGKKLVDSPLYYAYGACFFLDCSASMLHAVFVLSVTGPSYPRRVERAGAELL